MVEDAGGSNDDTSDGNGSFSCLLAHVEELDQNAEGALGPLQDQYD
jgi:hypothetical protein